VDIIGGSGSATINGTTVNSLPANTVEMVSGSTGTVEFKNWRHGTDVCKLSRVTITSQGAAGPNYVVHLSNGGTVKLDYTRVCERRLMIVLSPGHRSKSQTANCRFSTGEERPLLRASGFLCVTRSRNKEATAEHGISGTTISWLDKKVETRSLRPRMREAETQTRRDSSSWSAS
jgi:hypothetical protein